MNIKKIGLTALAGALVSVSANAADLSVTGGASLGFSGEENDEPRYGGLPTVSSLFRHWRHFCGSESEIREARFD